MILINSEVQWDVQTGSQRSQLCHSGRVGGMVLNKANRMYGTRHILVQ